jgi:drug/metabolite transporter (DMT)-like permease
MYGAAAIFQAIGTRSVAAVHGLDIRLLFRLLRSPSFDIALALTFGGFGLHLVALRQLPLFLAQSGIAASLAVTAVLAVIVFHDHLTPVEWSAVAAVCGGLVLLSLSAGETGSDQGNTGLTVAMVACLALMIVVGGISARLPGALATGLLGLMAGVGYAVVGVTARTLPGFSVRELATSGATYLLSAAGVIAFLLYSVSLQRGSVTVATAPMIAAQTIGPSLVGLGLLNDVLRPGWWPVALFGFALAGGASIVLVRSEGARGYAVRSTAPEPDEPQPAPAPKS